MMRSLFLGLLVLGMATMQAQTTKEMRDSLKAAARELSFHPDSVDLMLKKASWNLQLGEWAYAKDEYDKALSLQPTNIAALYYRAYVNERLNRYHFARLDYEHLFTLVPGNFEAQLGLALLNQKDNRFTQAMDQINRLVTQYPDSAIAYAARGGMERERKMYELAIYDYGEAIKRDSRNVDYRVNRIDLYLILGRREEAREELDSLVRMGVPRPSLSAFYNRLKP
ncbi:MAG: tetratricopeptide repeat protein [Prevotella sp.]